MYQIIDPIEQFTTDSKIISIKSVRNRVGEVHTYEDY